MRKCFKLYQVKFMLTHFMLREKCSNADRVFSGTYFPAFGLNTERYGVSLRIQSKCGKIQTRKNSVFGHFSRILFLCPTKNIRKP